jgi:hypothetical protein
MDFRNSKLWISGILGTNFFEFFWKNTTWNFIIFSLWNVKGVEAISSYSYEKTLAISKPDFSSKISIYESLDWIVPLVEVGKNVTTLFATTCNY